MAKKDIYSYQKEGGYSFFGEPTPGAVDGLGQGADWNKLAAYANPALESLENGASIYISDVLTEVSGVPVRFIDGTAASPGASWQSETSSGLYKVGTNNFGVSVGADLKFDWNATRIFFKNAYTLALGEDNTTDGFLHVYNEPTSAKRLLNLESTKAYSSATTDYYSMARLSAQNEELGITFLDIYSGFANPFTTTCADSFEGDALNADTSGMITVWDIERGGIVIHGFSDPDVQGGFYAPAVSFEANWGANRGSGSSNDRSAFRFNAVRPSGSSAAALSSASYVLEVLNHGTGLLMLTGTGNLGIGQHDPANKLHLTDTTSVSLSITNTSTGSNATDGLRLGLDSGAAGYLWHYDTEDLYFGTDNLERLRIAATGGHIDLTPSAKSSGTTHALTLTAAVNTGGANGLLEITNAAHTGQTASTEVRYAYFDLSSTVQWATGALANERAFYIAAPTLRFVGASTVTNAATLYIDRAPQAGSNATITNPYALWIGGGKHLRADGTNTVASAAGAIWDAVLLDMDVSLSGTTNVTTATGFNMVTLNAPTITDAGTITSISLASTLYIGGAPTGSGLTLTSAYALWVDSGNARFDGSVGIGTGTGGPDRALEVLDASNPQMRITHTDGTAYCDVQVYSDGGIEFISSASTLLYGGVRATVSTYVEWYSFNQTNSAGADAYMGSFVGGSSAGDPYYLFSVDPTASTNPWVIGVDNSASDKFMICQSAAVGTNPYLTITTTGQVGIAATAPETTLHVGTSGNVYGFGIGEQSGATGKQLLIGYYTTANYGVIQSVHQGSAFTVLHLQDYGGVIINDGGLDYDIRIASDDEAYCLMVEGTLNNIVLCANAEPGFNSMDGGVFLAEANVVPSGNPTGGGYLYVESGALKYRGTGGTITTMGPA